MATFLCPECKKEIPPDKSPYKHAVSCLNVPDRGVEQVARIALDRGDEWGNRVLVLMDEERKRRED